MGPEITHPRAESEFWEEFWEGKTS